MKESAFSRMRKKAPKLKAPKSEQHEGQHEDLAMISIVDTQTDKEIIPNLVPVKLDNDCFTGEVLIMIRTPDVDSPKELSPEGATPQKVSEYFKGKKRRFEFQFQIQLKKVPTGPLFLGCEVEELIKLSKVTKGLTSFLLAMIKRLSAGFHYSWGIEKGSADPELIKSGKYEKTHLSFPVESSMDRIVITPPGETPPELGSELQETPESHKRRRKIGGGSVDWQIGYTYTLGLWSAYMDWIQWKTMNVPGCRPFAMTSVTGNQPISLCVYELKNIDPQAYKKKKPPHNQGDLEVFTRLEFAHCHYTTAGIAPRFGEKGTSSNEKTDSEETNGGD